MDERERDVIVPGRRKRSLFVQLSGILLIMSLIPIVVVGVLSVSNISQYALQETARLGVSNLEAAVAALRYRLDEFRVLGIAAATDPTVIATMQAMRGHPDDQPDDIDRYRMRIALMTHYNESYLHSMYIFSPGGVAVTTQPVPMLDYDHLMETDWFRRGVQGGGNYFWGEPMQLNRNVVLPYVRRISDAENRVTLGYTVTNFYESAVHDFYASYGELSLLGENGVVLSSSDKASIGRNFYTHNQLAVSRVPGESGYLKQSLPGGGSGLLLYARDPLSGFVVARLMPYDIGALMVSDMMVRTAAIVGVCAVACVLLALLFSRNFIRPLRRIREHVDTLRLDMLDTRMRANTNDEIGMLIDSFNNMSRRINDSMDEIVRISEQQRKAEYRAIELQINPHFLYNTLSTVVWLADRGETERIKEVATSLSTLFRISVSGGRELIPIAQEIRHVRCYLDILAIRHSGRFHYQLDVDPLLLDHSIIKILLQPLVENAVQHGILEREIPHGIVRILVQGRQQDILFEVADNGDLPQQEVERMNARLQGEEGDGIGMRNVHDRIRHYYAGNPGLRCEKRGAMTVVGFTIPMEGERDV